MGSLAAIFAKTLHSIDTPSAQYLVEGVVHAIITPLPNALQPRLVELNAILPSRFRLLLMHGAENSRVCGNTTGNRCATCHPSTTYSNPTGLDHG